MKDLFPDKHVSDLELGNPTHLIVDDPANRFVLVFQKDEEFIMMGKTFEGWTDPKTFKDMAELKETVDEYFKD